VNESSDLSDIRHTVTVSALKAVLHLATAIGTKLSESVDGRKLPVNKHIYLLFMLACLRLQRPTLDRRLIHVILLFSDARRALF